MNNTSKTIMPWIGAHVRQTTAGKVLSSEVYEHYVAWARGAGSYIESHKAVIQTLQQAGFRTGRAGGARYVLGIAFVALDTLPGKVYI